MTRRIAALAAAGLLALAGCNTQPDEPEPRAQIVEKTHDENETINTPWGPQEGWWELEVCLLDAAGELTDECERVGVDRNAWDGYRIGDEYPVPESLKEGTQS